LDIGLSEVDYSDNRIASVKKLEKDAIVTSINALQNNNKKLMELFFFIEIRCYLSLA
jgi:hypothetical protein